MRQVEKQKYQDFDVVTVKALYRYPVPTATEFRTFLDRIPDFHPFKIAMGLIGIEAMRPIEVVNLKWSGLFFSKDNTEIEKIRHMVYKPKNRITWICRKTFYKEIEKPMFSKWLSDQIMGYREIYPQYAADKVFPWTTTHALSKLFTQARKSVSKGVGDFKDCPFLLEENTYQLKGQDKSLYRLHPYSFRRFAFSFHYYMTFGRDAVSLSRAFGHTKTETTMNHYVFPYETIGLCEDNVLHSIDIDTLLGFKLTNRKLTEFYQGVKKQVYALRCPGQRSLFDYGLIT